jgi:hypothetical protein
MIVSGLFPNPRSAGNLTLFLPEVLFAGVFRVKRGRQLDALFASVLSLWPMERD